VPPRPAVAALSHAQPGGAVTGQVAAVRAVAEDKAQEQHEPPRPAVAARSHAQPDGAEAERGVAQRAVAEDKAVE